MKTPSNIVSKDATATNGNLTRRNLFMRYGMLACCVVMLLPVGGYFLGGGTLSGLLDNLLLLVPLLACVGMHFVLHRLMGRSCHGGHEDMKTPVRSTEPDRDTG